MTDGEEGAGRDTGRGGQGEIPGEGLTSRNRDKEDGEITMVQRWKMKA